jgi:putative membrane protein
MLSALERQVVMLGDAGIHAHVQTLGWEQHVQHIVASMRAGTPAQGVCEVIARLGEVLAANLPPRADDQDELSNRVRQDER